MQSNFVNDIIESVKVFTSGGLILYPTDTIWGIGCDATNEKAVKQIFSLKKRDDKKSMIILVADENDIYSYVEDADEKIFKYLSATKKPTTVIYKNAKNIANNLINQDGSIAIRIIKDDFCKELINKFERPIVSTSANISGRPSPRTFKEISSAIKNGVDYIVQHRQNDLKVSEPSSIIKLDEDGNIITIR